MGNTIKDEESNEDNEDNEGSFNDNSCRFIALSLF